MKTVAGSGKGFAQALEKGIVKQSSGPRQARPLNSAIAPARARAFFFSWPGPCERDATARTSETLLSRYIQRPTTAYLDLID
jgi:hypothetical protein